MGAYDMAIEEKNEKQIEDSSFYMGENKRIKEEENAKRKGDGASFKFDKAADPFIIAIDTGEKYFGLAYTDLNNPQTIIPSHPMERIAVLIKKPDKIIAVGRKATEKFIEMEDCDLDKYVYVNEIKHNELDEKIPETDFLNIELFAISTLDVINRMEKEIGKTFKDMLDVRMVFSAGCHWRKNVKKLMAKILESGTPFNWELGQEKVAFIEKVETVSQFIREAQAASYCLNFNVENLKIESNTGYAVLNVGFGSCHLTFLQGRDVGHVDKRGSGGTTRKDWKDALPEDHIWLLCKKIIDEKYHDNRKYHVRLIYQYENLHWKIRMRKKDTTVFPFSFPKYIFNDNFKKLADDIGIDIEEEKDLYTLCFKWSLLKSCFIELKELVKGVIENSTEDFKKYEVKCVFIIGGYNIMELVQNAAKNEWFKNVTVVIPDDAGVCYAVGGATAGTRGFVKFDAICMKGYPHWN